MTPEYGGADGIEPALWFYAKEADAMVTTGSLDRGAKLSAPAKVIGCKKDEIVIPYPTESISPWSEITLERRSLISGGIDYLGLMSHTCQAG